MYAIKTKLAALEKQFLSMMPPGEEPVTFIFDNGKRVTFKNGHDALIFAIKNRNNADLQNVTIETKNKAILAKAILDVDNQKTKGE